MTYYFPMQVFANKNIFGGPKGYLFSSGVILLELVELRLCGFELSLQVSGDVNLLLQLRLQLGHGVRERSHVFFGLAELSRDSVEFACDKKLI